MPLLMQADPATDKPEPIIICAPLDAAPDRTDRFLASTVGHLSRSRIKTMVQSGQVTRDEVVLHDPADPVHPGARYVLQSPALTSAIPAPQSIPLSILFEDDHLIVLDKQAGLVTHPAPGNEEGTLVNALLAHCGDTLPGIGGERRPGIVHRLDKDTSGVMVIAKTEPALAALSADFASRTLERSYLALVWGAPTPAHGAWSGPIGRDPRDRKRMAVVAGGKPAVTNYARLDGVGLAVSLLRCRLQTGRTHQIRVHAASAGHPLVGDPVYLRRVPAAAAKIEPGARTHLLEFPRQALHASVLAFRHPATGAALRFETLVPPDFVQLLTCIGLDTALHNS